MVRAERSRTCTWTTSRRWPTNSKLPAAPGPAARPAKKLPLKTHSPRRLYGDHLPPATKLISYSDLLFKQALSMKTVHLASLHVGSVNARGQCVAVSSGNSCPLHCFVAASRAFRCAIDPSVRSFLLLCSQARHVVRLLVAPQLLPSAAFGLSFAARRPGCCIRDHLWSQCNHKHMH